MKRSSSSNGMSRSKNTKSSRSVRLSKSPNNAYSNKLYYQDVYVKETNLKALESEQISLHNQACTFKPELDKKSM